MKNKATLSSFSSIPVMYLECSLTSQLKLNSLTFNSYSGVIMKQKFEGSKEDLATLKCYVKLARGAETITATIHRHLAGEKLTISQFGVLEALHHLGSMCQRDVARKILKSTANITTVIDNLEKRGLVERERSDTDRRYITLHLTQEGAALIQRIFPSHLQGVVKAFQCLTKDEQQTLGDLCKKLGLAQKL